MVGARFAPGYRRHPCARRDVTLRIRPTFGNFDILFFIS